MLRKRPLSVLMMLHRWLGVLACLAVLIFALSGFLHPLMSRSQPQPARFSAPAIAVPQDGRPLRAVLQDNGIERFHAANLALLPSGPAWRVEPESGPARYFSLRTGTEIGDGERQHATALARHFLGDAQTPLAQPTRIEAFDDDYPQVNRLLPVWRVRLARPDGLTAYIDTAGNRLGTLVDDRKRALQTVFRALHNFQSLKDHPRTRLVLMLTLLTATVFTAGAGLWLFFALKRANQRLRQRPARRWHRRLSLLIGLSALSFSVSGGWHLLQELRDVPSPTAPRPLFQTAALGDFLPAGGAVLLQVDGRACYRIASPAAPMMMMQHHHDHARRDAPAPASVCLDARDGSPVPAAERSLAQQLGRYYANTHAAVAELEAVDRFTEEYGFINKRLPVWKIRFADSASHWYVETASGALALRAEPGTALESFVFGYFHKARFIGDAYKDWRDAALMVFALGNVAVALLGLWLLITRYRPVGARAIAGKTTAAGIE